MGCVLASTRGWKGARGSGEEGGRRGSGRPRGFTYFSQSRERRFSTFIRNCAAQPRPTSRSAQFGSAWLSSTLLSLVRVSRSAAAAAAAVNAAADAV